MNMELSHRQLKQILKDENVPLRSYLKTKKQMYDVLVDRGYFKLVNTLHIIPTEIVYYILSKLEPAELLRFCSTNKYMNAICQDDLLWKSLFSNNYVRNYDKNDMSWFELCKDFTIYPYEVVSFGGNQNSKLYKRGRSKEAVTTKVKMYGDLGSNKHPYPMLRHEMTGHGFLLFPQNKYFDLLYGNVQFKNPIFKQVIVTPGTL